MRSRKTGAARLAIPTPPGCLSYSSSRRGAYAPDREAAKHSAATSAWLASKTSGSAFISACDAACAASSNAIPKAFVCLRADSGMRTHVATVRNVTFGSSTCMSRAKETSSKKAPVPWCTLRKPVNSITTSHGAVCADEAFFLENASSDAIGSEDANGTPPPRGLSGYAALEPELSTSVSQVRSTLLVKYLTSARRTRATFSVTSSDLTRNVRAWFRYTAPGCTVQNAFDASISSTVKPVSTSTTRYRSLSIVRTLTPNAGPRSASPTQRRRKSPARLAQTRGSRASFESRTSASTATRKSLIRSSPFFFRSPPPSSSRSPSSSRAALFAASVRKYVLASTPSARGSRGSSYAAHATCAARIAGFAQSMAARSFCAASNNFSG
mmetsp:Transcript_14326/g.60347  ORF Transcript_14326/g.60347 Transcript_14326/m.60347 type:complete len:383 (-) Transcript_14326:2409-3557(-)